MQMTSTTPTSLASYSESCQALITSTIGSKIRPRISPARASGTGLEDKKLSKTLLKSADGAVPQDVSPRLPPDLHFTPVNSPNENSGPCKPVPQERFYSSHTSTPIGQSYGRRCRLIGFTPLVEDTISSEEDSANFLGPRKVKAKEVAPCALFYKRADVFVSSEMKSQNVLSYSENHYRSIRFDDEVSINELEYAPQPPNQSNRPVQLSIQISQATPNLATRAEKFDSVKFGTHGVVQKPICHIFSKHGLTSMPLASEAASEFDFNHNTFQFFDNETESPLTASSSGVEQTIPWIIPSNYPVSDPEQSTSSTSSSGLQSSLWDDTMSSFTRATSPVSSIYSNVSPSCNYHQSLTASSCEEECAPVPSQLTLPRVALNNDEVPTKILVAQGLFDWHEDDGSLGDDENDSDCLSSQPESDEDEDSGAYKKACFELVSCRSLADFGGKEETAMETRPGKITGEAV